VVNLLIVNRSRIVAMRSYQVVSNLFFDPIRFAHRWLEFPSYVQNLARYRARQSQSDRAFDLHIRYLYPVLGDRHAGAGVASGHYFHQDIWAARLIHARNPPRHVDVGSSIAGFIAHLLCFREVEYVDIRPLNSNVSGLNFVQGDVTALPYETASVESLSALHVVEHIGLGRYGDVVDPDGWRKGVSELKRVLKPGGTLYFSVPVGHERLEFDAHRVFNPLTIIDAVRPLVLNRFDAVDDAGHFVPHADPTASNGWYSCGLFEFSATPQ
jgi:SAM-dependent methyltransferase